MPRVIVNSTPLIVLCGIGQLEILKAKRQGIIEAVHPLLSGMKQKGFYIDSALENAVLRQAGEIIRENGAERLK